MALRLEVFDQRDAGRGSATVVLEQSALEDAKLEAYEKGYTAGWDDAVQAASTDQAQVRADLARCLQDLSFTFQEARAHVLGALEPLFTELLGQVMPQAARLSLVPILAEVLQPLAAELADRPVTLTFNPAVRPALEPLVSEIAGLPLTLVEEPTLSEGQVILRMGGQEQRVDLDGTLNRMASLMHEFFSLPELERRHG